MSRREMPMFPLGNPAVPFATLALHVFEERYRTLMQRVMSSDRLFGIVMISRGSEVGGGEVRSDVGVVMEIVDAEELEDGRWALLAVGMSRLRVVEWLTDDPHPRAVVQEIDESNDPVELVVRDEMQAAVRRIAGMLTELDEPAAPITIELDSDPVIAAWQAVAVTPVGPLDLQGLLEIDDLEQRLEATTEVLKAIEELVRLRIGGPIKGSTGE